MLEKGAILNNRYKVLDSIGKGGSSLVYLIRDIRIGKLWALKEIPRRDKMAYSLAKRELNLLKSINYEKFPRITDAFVSESALYLVNDYVEGISLDRIIFDKRISRYKAVKWAGEILDALDYLHGLSPPILYLDLKPENILVLPNGNIKMIDFGIARRITTDYIPMGTPGYAAPEQYEYNGDNLSEQTDIFAFGMTYYAMRMGCNPDEDIEKVRYQISKSGQLSHSEKILILKCIQTNVADRYDNVMLVSYQLKQICSNKLNPGKILNCISLVGLLVFLIIVGSTVYINEKGSENARRQMIADASNYINEGEYTLEGLKIITTFIDSGCLDENSMESFAYDVAMNYFLIQHDYNKAYRYFSKLDENEYPEVMYMMKLCNAQTGFIYDDENIIECIGRLYDMTYKMADGQRKYEVYIFVAQCYENYDSDTVNGVKKALIVLEEGQRQLLSNASSMSLEDVEALKIKYEKRIEMLYEKAKYRIK